MMQIQSPARSHTESWDSPPTSVTTSGGTIPAVYVPVPETWGHMGDIRLLGVFSLQWKH